MEQPRADDDDPSPEAVGDASPPTPEPDPAVPEPDPAPTSSPEAAPSPEAPSSPVASGWAPLAAPAPAPSAWAVPPAPGAPMPALAPLPVEATLRTAMDDIGWGFWWLLAIGAAGFAPIWAAVLLLGDNPLSTIVQFLAIVPSAALLAGAGAVRAGRRPRFGELYRRALARLLHYFLANLLVGVIVFLVMLVPVIIAVVAGVAVSIGTASDPGPTAAIILLTIAIGLLPVAYIAARLSLIGPLVVVEGMAVGEAITEGWRRTRRQVLRVLAVFVVGGIPAILVALGATMLAFGLLTQPVASGLVFGLGYAVAMVVVTCVNVATWQRLGGTLDQPPEAAMANRVDADLSPVAAPARPRADRGPMTAIVLLVVGLSLFIAGSTVAVGKVAGWVDALSGQSDGHITYGLNGIGCFQPDERTEFAPGDVVHLVADLSLAIPAGQRLAYEVYADGQLIDRGYEEPFAEETECLYFDLDTRDITPADYTFRYLWAAEVVAEGTFTIHP